MQEGARTAADSPPFDNWTPAARDVKTHSCAVCIIIIAENGEEVVLCNPLAVNCVEEWLGSALHALMVSVHIGARVMQENH